MVDPPRALLIPGDPLEAYYYTHFFTTTIYGLEISETLNRHFWQKAFQGPSQNVLCIRHAVMALGAVHWQFTTCDDKRPSNLDGFTLRHYNEAIHDLVHEGDSTSESTTNLVTILTCCVLFALLESLRGNFREAIRHIKSGTELIANHKPSTYLPNHDIEDLAAMFHAISGQVGIFSHNRLFADMTQFMTPKKKYSRPAEKLRDLVEAEDTMNTFDDVANHITWDLNDDCEGGDSECKEQWAILRQRLTVWEYQFSAIVTDIAGSDEYSKNLDRIVNLKIQYKLWELALGEDGPEVDCGNTARNATSSLTTSVTCGTSQRDRFTGSRLTCPLPCFSYMFSATTRRCDEGSYVCYDRVKGGKFFGTVWSWQISSRRTWLVAQRVFKWKDGRT
jgi:hypothetical protein